MPPAKRSLPKEVKKDWIETAILKSENDINKINTHNIRQSVRRNAGTS